ncbi:type I restriction-modification system endonuclease [Pontiella agarivorans]|uniref:Type I restriction-modification system endonuclease n=1 Tax=Pontiella agarivorans TaxID=3038953 RepID=A0ABU5MVF9_9BACT|nr:type I restriction-modification system endonuclease [Pontiella agarivorans]MDZ8118180.1 type I restriction-modification system endonuclease [Pontiella agarivorans]
MSNFDFLMEQWPEVAEMGVLAEKHLYQDPNAALIKLRLLAETQTRYLIAYENLNEPFDGTQIKRLNLLQSKGIIPDTLGPLFHSIRKAGNRATHEGFGSVEAAQTQLKVAYRLAEWFAKTYSTGHVTVQPFSMPEPAESQEELEFLASELIRANEQLEQENSKLLKKLETVKGQEVTKEQRSERRKSSARVSKKIKLSEAETRQLIDDQLNAAGWIADTVNLRYAKGTRPEKGRNKAIAEWPTASGPADYALFVGMDLIGFVEAKKWDRQVVSDVGQAKRYSRDVEIKGEESFIAGPWNQYKAPFMFATNGRPYLQQLKDKSGIWFLDGREPTNHPKPLHAWYSPEGLKDLLKHNIPEACKKLGQEPFDYLGLRRYQETAIRKVEEALQNNQKSILLAMATGTGKTRTALGLIYRMIKSDRFKRVLFLVDRNALGEQASNSFHDVQIEDFLSFAETFGVKDITKADVESDTRVDVSTVQSMMRRIMFNSNDANIPTVDQYDCIVVDEAHRGYTLDREMSDTELEYRDQNDYISKYRKVIEYFDAVKIGMTATPAPHTAEIFGKPVYTYSYREAVIDGWLIDHEPPHQITTKLSKSGIKWKKGETVPVLDTKTGEVTNLEEIPDELNIEVDGFNQKVLTTKFNRTVVKELIKDLDPNGDEKTLIYAATDDHADTVVRILKEEFDAMGCPVDDDAIQKITGSIDRPSQAIRHFKNEKFPNIAVTVDLLTTGIDVPAICNLVFIRRVRSRILYEQMLGRATRLCPEIKKDHFNIYDAVRMYEALEKVTNMKPVAPNPKTTLVTLVEELLDMDDPDKQKLHIDQLVAKLQRKARGLKGEAAEKFETLTGGVTITEFIKDLREAEPQQVHTIVQNSRRYFEFLDENNRQPRRVLISNHEDELESHTRGYGKAEKPEDYLNEFKAFILDNMNKIPALSIVCQRPRELTRQSLKELKLELDLHGFSEKTLRVAWHEWTNEDIAADVISFIRRQALGDPLLSHEERIKNAVQKIRAMSDWTAIQKNWLDRFEMQLMKENIIQKDDLNEGVFQEEGGFNRINKIFQGRLTEVIDQLNEALYPEQRMYG